LIFLTKEFYKSIKYKYATIDSPESLINLHFETWASPQHINKEAFLETIKELNGKPAKILETGTSAWGTDSTRLWDKYIKHFGGEFTSIDIRKEPANRLKRHMQNNTKLLIGDSVSVLEQIKSSFNIYFFDSYDLDLHNPEPCALHGLREYMAIKHKLRINDIVFVDDTPIHIDHLPKESKVFFDTHKVLPGKGAFVIPDLIKSFTVDIIHHQYSFVAVIRELTPRVKTNGIV